LTHKNLFDVEKRNIWDDSAAIFCDKG